MTISPCCRSRGAGAQGDNITLLPPPKEGAKGVSISRLICKSGYPHEGSVHALRPLVSRTASGDVQAS